MHLHGPRPAWKVVPGVKHSSIALAHPITAPSLSTLFRPRFSPFPQVRLEAVPEMGYDPSANPPRGEVCIRGPTLFSGYYKDKALTDECMGEAPPRLGRARRGGVTATTSLGAWLCHRRGPPGRS